MTPTTDFDAMVAAQLGVTVEQYRADRRAANIAACLHIAKHLETSGRVDPSGNTAATFRAVARRLAR